MDSIGFQEFRKEILKLSFFDYDEQQSLFELAKKCAGKTGLSLGGMGAAGTAALGPGAAVGFLAGLVTGTAVCTTASVVYKDQIRAMLAEGN